MLCESLCPFNLFCSRMVRPIKVDVVGNASIEVRHMVAGKHVCNALFNKVYCMDDESYNDNMEILSSGLEAFLCEELDTIATVPEHERLLVVEKCVNGFINHFMDKNMRNPF